MDDLILGHAPSLARMVEQRENAGNIRSALAKLPDEIRPVLELYYLEEWSIAQIAEFLALPSTTVKWRMHAGRKLLRASLSHLMEKTNESGK
jgi:RNA polymerase sigma-70 factor (ECF subfamily)